MDLNELPTREDEEGASSPHKKTAAPSLGSSAMDDHAEDKKRDTQLATSEDLAVVQEPCRESEEHEKSAVTDAQAEQELAPRQNTVLNGEGGQQGRENAAVQLPRLDHGADTTSEPQPAREDEHRAPDPAVTHDEQSPRGMNEDEAVDHADTSAEPASTEREVPATEVVGMEEDERGDRDQPMDDMVEGLTGRLSRKPLADEDLEEEPPGLGQGDEEMQTEVRVRPRRNTSAKRALESAKVRRQPKRTRKEPTKDNKKEAEKKEGNLDRAAAPKQDSGEVNMAEGKDEEDGEDVCFVCYDGGTIHKCDKGGCPKWYHAQCIGREDDFFSQPGGWSCGWHTCTECGKRSQYRCLTCQRAYCSSCIRSADFLKLKGKLGLCDLCLPLVNLIEHGGEGAPPHLDDVKTEEGLFKAYWMQNKASWGVTSVPRLGEDGRVIGPPLEEDDAPVTRARKEIPQEDEGDADEDLKADEGEGVVEDEREFKSWASPELLAFLEKRGRDITQPLTNFKVNGVIWEHIREHGLHSKDRRLVVCDEALYNLFHTREVTQFQILKLLSEHFPKRKGRARGTRRGQRAVSDPDEDEDEPPPVVSPSSRGRLVRVGSNRRRNSQRSPSPEAAAPSDYAAISEHNVKLLYLKRGLLESMLDEENFDQVLTKAFVRIRVESPDVKQMYRLVLVNGVTEGDEYAVGKKKTRKVLHIQNLSRQEDVTIDQLSNQDFTLDDLKRLRRAIKKARVYKALTVGELEDKAQELHPFKVKEEMEAEKQRLANLRDRASEMGKKKELRETVEKLTELEKPATLAAKLEAPLRVEVDPHMDPAVQESDSDEDENANPNDAQKQAKGAELPTPRRHDSRGGTHGSRRPPPPSREPASTTPRSRPRQDWPSKDTPGGQSSRRGADSRDVASSDRDRETRRPPPVAISREGDRPRGGPRSPERSGGGRERGPALPRGPRVDDRSRDTGGSRDRPLSGGYRPPPPPVVGPPSSSRGRGFDRLADSAPSTSAPLGAPPTRSLGPRVYSPRNSNGTPRGWSDRPHLASPSYQPGARSDDYRALPLPGGEPSPRGGWRNDPSRNPRDRPLSRGGGVPLVSPRGVDLPPGGVPPPEIAPVWHYRDPMGIVQGPFTVEQLRKWSATGAFPEDLRVWRVNEREAQSILLLDALAGRVMEGYPPGGGGFAGGHPPMAGGPSPRAFNPPRSDFQKPYPPPGGPPRGGPYNEGHWESEGRNGRAPLSINLPPRGVEEAHRRPYRDGEDRGPPRGVGLPSREYEESGRSIGGGQEPMRSSRGWDERRGAEGRSEVPPPPQGGPRGGRRPCKYWLEGHCRKGKICDFAHE